MAEHTVKKNDKRAERDALFAELLSATNVNSTLVSWNAFIDVIDVPMEIYPALTTGRMELLKLMQPRALTAEETKVVYDLIGNLIRTNSALRAHAQQVAHQVDLWSASFKQLHTVGQRIDDFANFRAPVIDEEA